MADFEVNLPAVPIFKQQTQDIIYRSTQVVQNMDRDKVKKHLRSFTKNQRYFTCVADVRDSVSIAAMARHKQKLVASNQFAAGARADEAIQQRRSVKIAARQQNARLFVDQERCVAACDRMKALMDQSAEEEKFDFVRCVAGWRWSAGWVGGWLASWCLALHPVEVENAKQRGAEAVELRHVPWALGQRQPKNQASSNAQLVCCGAPLLSAAGCNCERRPAVWWSVPGLCVCVNE
jgi:hypothetical protein